MFKKNSSEMSLQLLSMPDFARQLKFGELDEGRSSYLGSEQRYRNPKVLIGSWWQGGGGKRKEFPRNSLYRMDYLPPSGEEVTKEFTANRTRQDDYSARDKGLPFDLLTNHGRLDEPRVWDTMYWKAYGGPRGLLNEAMRQFWDWETDIRVDYSTTYKKDFVKHRVPVYSTLRSPPKACSTSFTAQGGGLSSTLMVSDTCPPPGPRTSPPLPILPEFDHPQIPARLLP